jgi:hypothetical protein
MEPHLHCCLDFILTGNDVLIDDPSVLGRDVSHMSQVWNVWWWVAKDSETKELNL